MANADKFGFGTQIRKSPYFDATVRWGATGFSVYNHMYIPRDFGDPEQNFWNLVNEAILCDVAVERQVEITGPDAAKFIQMLTPRNLSNYLSDNASISSSPMPKGGLLTIRSYCGLPKTLLDVARGQRCIALGAGCCRTFRAGCHNLRT